MSLNAQQIAVLDWIKAGCPEGVYDDDTNYSHRTSARALANRGLVTIHGHGPTWTATLTARGKVWPDATTEEKSVRQRLAERDRRRSSGTLSDSSPGEPPSRPRASAKSSKTTERKAGPVNIRPARTAAPAAEVAAELAAADRLITQVLEAGGWLVLPEDPAVIAEHERLVAASLRSSLRPKGKRLAIVSVGEWGRGPKAIELTEHFDECVQARPVPVLKHVGTYHPIVKAYLANKDGQYVTAEHLTRAAHILQAVAAEAGKRGLDVFTAERGLKEVNQHSLATVREAHLVLRTPAGVYGLQIREISAPGGAKLARRSWNAPKTMPDWQERRGREFISTGKLDLVVRGPWAPGGDHYRDAKSWTVEDLLPEVFRSFEINKLRSDASERERKRREDERRRQWEVAMASAKEAYAVHARWERFKGRSSDWHEIQQHRAFLAEARRVVERYDGEDRQVLIERLAEAESGLNARDPILHIERLAADPPQPRPEELKPFLKGWSPYGP
ncbi:hypothetical protein [Raineyella sp. W15-4]|uniref:hypothetical protein n=1 Tax=Raineyella sp. W15-4 TaxID=3081651 RepID=UPI0029530565|nr:hypothetical protein [Raineyella sp. W15-4]WOQ17580.1 hypothetical protein R0145_02375 [Raineyella sp. W15-4]